MAAACRRLHGRGLLAGGEGNISVRLPDGALLVTPSGMDKATLMPGDILLQRRHADGTEYFIPVANGDERAGGGDIGARPSSELGMHRACYAARADVHAVVHAHPPAATALATVGQTLPADVLPELPVVVGPVALVPYARPGTPALGLAMAPYLGTHSAFLLANHGVTTVGATLGDALTRLETVEQAARIFVIASLLGGAVRLPAAEASALAALFRQPAAAPYV